MIWLSLIFPIFGAIILFIKFRDKLTWWELVIPLGISLLFTILFKFTVQKVQVSDTEYWGGLGIKAIYYEPWETWVDKTCSRQVRTGTDSKGNAQYRTEYYDCSYCDDNGPRWVLENNLGESFSISQEKYNELRERWNSSPTFIELNRNIDYHFGCGQDGDAYYVSWNKQPITSESTTESHTYENRVQAAHSAFDFPEVTKEDISTYGLYNYPDIKGYNQQSVLGIDSVKWLVSREADTLKKMINYMNGEMGHRKQLKVWVLIFKDKPHISALMQEVYWKGGNKNEMVVCIGLNSKTKWIQWVKAFSWTPNRRILVDVREDLMQTGEFRGYLVYDILKKDLEKFERRHFKEFSYISVDPPKWAIITTFIISIIVTALSCYWSVINEFEADRFKPWKTVTNWNNKRY